jgi:AcrR family transcriptional regulator
MSPARHARSTAAAARPRRAGRPPGPSQAPRLRQHLIEEASALYAAGGYGGLSFGTLAARTGLRKATLFHYFPNKNALVDAVFRALGERLEAAALAFDPPPASYADRLDRLVATLVDFCGRDALNARILCHGLLEVDRPAARLAGGVAPPVFTHFVERFVDFLNAGIAAGELYPDRPLGTIMSIAGEGATSLAARREEMITTVRRAVVRGRARLQRGADRAGSRR